MRSSVIATTFAILVATSAHAQAPTWVALDTQPGQPATVVFRPRSSQSTSPRSHPPHFTLR